MIFVRYCMYDIRFKFLDCPADYFDVFYIYEVLILDYISVFISLEKYRYVLDGNSK